MPFFQVLSRNNDVNGNPFRLFVVYQSDGSIAFMAEARSSSPNYRHGLLSKGYREIMSLHLAPSTYNTVKRNRVSSIKLFYVD